MNTISQLDQGSKNYLNLYKEAEQARAYIDITNTHGPSEQLLAFINYDGGLQSELGLEGFNDFSLQTRHELLLSKLNPDLLDQMALEGLMDTLKKWGGVLTGVGAVSTMVGIPLGIPLIVAGLIGLRANANAKQVAAYKEFTSSAGATEKAMSTAKAIVGTIPNDFTEASWKKFNDRLNNTSFIDIEAGFPLVKFEVSGWTESNFIAAGKWIDINAGSGDELIKECNEKVTKIEKWLYVHDDEKAVTKLIGDAVPDIKKAVGNYLEHAMRTAHVVASAAKCFEEKKK